ncbi:MAG: hypothetical protein ACRCZ6_13025 [Kluyvera sp.]|uniref:hypothetical protein n=1 Tax=Kluyvera sp. TaxID=1538228 RepID=UPI003F2F703B
MLREAYAINTAVGRVGLALLLDFIASGNRRSFWGWFILGLIIDPIFAGLLYWLIAKDRV